MESAQAPQVEQVLGKIQGLDAREFQLWSASVVIIIALAAGLLAFMAPRVVWNLQTIHIEGRYLHQFFFGLTVLVILYNVYTVDLRRRLHYTREALVRQLLRAEAAETLSLLDPLTQIFNRRYLDRLMRNEIGRVDRSGADLTLLLIDLDGFKSVNTRFGHVTGDHVLKELAELLNASLRRSDIVVRYGGDEFIAVMPDTTEQQAERVVERLHKATEEWNSRGLVPGYNMSVSCGAAAYRKGASVEELIATSDRRMYEAKARQDQQQGAHS